MVSEVVSKHARRAKHLLRSGSLIGSADHFLVILPSILVIANVHLAFSPNPIIDLSTIFFICGAGELVFLIVTKGKIPLIMGPSFAHITLATYYISNFSQFNSYDELRSTILWGYIFSGIIILLLAFLYRLDIFRRICHFLFPDVVMGPAISLIGLGVAALAVEDTGINTGDVRNIIISLVTLSAIILLTLTKRKYLRNATILLGILIGCAYASFKGVFNFLSAVQTSELLCGPRISFSFLRHLPQNWFSLLLLVIPPSIVSFIESLGRITVLDGMYKQTPPDEKYYKEDKLFFGALSGHGISHVFSAVFGSAPCAIYAENIAVMNMNRTNGHRDIKEDYEDVAIVRAYKAYSIYPYVFASIFFIVVSCFYPFQSFFHLIPKPVIGGMELFIFGLVAAPGIQLLVEKRVDYNKISNQVITASVLIAGISGISLRFATIELSGMGLGLVIGLGLNLITKVLSAFGVLNEQITIEEVITICCERYPNSITITLKAKELKEQLDPYTEKELKAAMQQEEFKNQLNAADTVFLELSCEERKKEIKIKKNPGGMDITFPMGKKEITQIHNDYNDFFLNSDDKTVTIRVRSEMPSRVLKQISRKSRKAPYIYEDYTFQ